MIPQFSYVITLPLKYTGDCSIIGITPDQILYMEETYGDGWLAQTALRLDGEIIAAVDQDAGQITNVAPLPLPPDLCRPHSGWQTMAMLNFSGPRHRGLAEAERAADLMQPMSIHDKMALVSRYHLDILPPMLLGLAESYVLAEAPLIAPHVHVVCRRLRLAYRLAGVQHDTDGQPYDYDTRVIYAAHIYDRRADLDVAIPDRADNLPGVDLHRPMDCLIAGGHLFVADGGDGERRSCVHVWRVPWG